MEIKGIVLHKTALTSDTNWKFGSSYNHSQIQKFAWELPESYCIHGYILLQEEDTD